MISRGVAPDYDMVQESVDDVVVFTYEELRTIAHRRLVAHGHGGTLSTTGLVHEAYLKLADGTHGWRDRAHFFALASLAMRLVLVDRARERSALKRGGVHHQITLRDDILSVEDQPEVVLQLDEALEKLASVDLRLAKVVECRFFGGLSEADTAEALGVTIRTIQRDWVKARVLLRRMLEQ